MEDLWGPCSEGDAAPAEDCVAKERVRGAREAFKRFRKASSSSSSKSSSWLLPVCPAAALRCSADALICPVAELLCSAAGSACPAAGQLKYVSDGRLISSLSLSPNLAAAELSRWSAMAVCSVHPTAEAAVSFGATGGLSRSLSLSALLARELVMLMGLEAMPDATDPGVSRPTCTKPFTACPMAAAMADD